MRAAETDGRPPAHLLLRIVLALVGLGVTANAAWLAVTANFSLGTALTGVLGLVLLGWGAWLPRIPRWAHATLTALLVAAVGLSSFLIGVGRTDTATYDEDAVVVLGAAVHGRELSRTLASRLDVALAYRERNPGALVVVSGGQGPQEDLPEGHAMQAYLLAHGVPADRIVVEDQAASTEENFAFSKQLLDARLAPGYRVAFVTDEFHVYRAGRIAAAAGLPATHVSSRTPWYFWGANFLREDVVVVLNWLSLA